MNLKILNFEKKTSKEGNLFVYEKLSFPEFSFKRLFSVKSKKNSIRGNHAHKKCTQIIICINGACEVATFNGKKKEIFLLNKPEIGLLIPPMIWSTQKYLEQNTIINVLCNELYDTKDYIHNLDEFKSMIF